MPIQAANDQPIRSKQHSSTKRHFTRTITCFQRLCYALYIVVSSRGSVLRLTQLHQAPTNTKRHLSMQQSGHAAYPRTGFLELSHAIFVKATFIHATSLSMQRHYPSNTTGWLAHAKTRTFLARKLTFPTPIFHHANPMQPSTDCEQCARRTVHCVTRSSARDGC